jgi:hypothetical protein
MSASYLIEILPFLRLAVVSRATAATRSCVRRSRTVLPCGAALHALSRAGVSRRVAQPDGFVRETNFEDFSLLETTPFLHGYSLLSDGVQLSSLLVRLSL